MGFCFQAKKKKEEKGKKEINRVNKQSKKYGVDQKKQNKESKKYGRCSLVRTLI